jgi:hypothetical protein
MPRFAPYSGTNSDIGNFPSGGLQTYKGPPGRPVNGPKAEPPVCSSFDCRGRRAELQLGNVDVNVSELSNAEAGFESHCRSVYIACYEV